MSISYKNSLFSLIIPVGIIVIISSIFAFSYSSKADSELSDKLAGKILLQIENNGEAWYLDPDSKSRLFLGRPDDAYRIMKELGLGIKAKELATYLDSSFPKRLAGKILLSVEEHGEAYYINPDNLKGYYLGIPQDAFNIMRELSLGINNEDIEKIEVYKENNNQEGQEEQGSSSGSSSSSNTNSNNNNDDSDSKEKSNQESDDQAQNQEITRASIKTMSPEPVFHFSNIMTVHASLGEDKDNIDNIDNIKEWGIVWDYNNIPGIEIKPTLEDNRYRVSGDINQIKEKQGKLSLDIVGLAPSTFPYIRSYLVLEDGSVIYGNVEALYRYNQEQKEGEREKANGGISNINTSYIAQGMPSSLLASNIKVYQLTYTSGANGFLSGKTSQAVSSGGDASLVIANPGAGYSFLAWSDGLTNNSRTDQSVKSNLTLTANFIANDYTITFNAQEGVISTSTKKVTYNQEVGTLPTPTRAGHSFTGWNTAPTGDGPFYTSTTVYTTTRNITLYSIWEVLETCSDGIQNQDEAAVDCGGPNCAPCLTYPYGISNDWRWDPVSVVATSTFANALLLNQDASFIEIEPGQNEEVLIELSTKDNGGVFTYQILDNEAEWNFNAYFSENSSNGIDGDWLALTTEEVTNYGPEDRLRKVVLPSNKSGWFKFSATNNGFDNNSLGSIGLREFSEGLDDDYWIFVGASIVSMFADYQEMNPTLHSSYGYDPLIFNHGNSSMTIGWLDDNIEEILALHPKSKFVFVHMGGNNVSNKRPYSTMTQGDIDDFYNDYYSVIEKIKNANKVPVPSRLTFRNYPHDPLGKPGVYDGGMEQNGSLPFNNNIIDPIINELASDFYNSNNSSGYLDLYTFILNNQSILNTDGVHPSYEGRGDIRSYLYDNLFSFVYQGSFPDALTPMEFNNPAEDADDLVAIAENTRELADINVAQDKVNELDSWPEFSTQKSSLQVRIDSIEPKSQLKFFIDFGDSDSIYLSSPGWNNITSITDSTPLNLITDTGATSTLNLAVTYEFKGVISNTGLNFVDIPNSATRDAFSVRGYVSTDSELTLSGVDTETLYTLSFYSSGNNDSGYVTDFTINGITKSVISSSNNSDIVEFTNISPDINNEIIISINSDTSYGYLNAMSIQEQ